MPFFNYKNHACYYREIGEGEPLLLLHGNTASSNMFADIAKLYSSDYKVILIDFLGHGKSDRIEEFPIDLWFDEAQQVIEFLKQKNYSSVRLVGSSGGALVAINVALEAPELVYKVIADSFEGDKALPEITQFIEKDREQSKRDESARQFYYFMHGENWESVVDNDTAAVVQHERIYGDFFHKPLQQLKADILFTASKEDEFVQVVGNDFFDKTFGNMIKSIGHGSMNIFETGRHPVMLSNAEEFAAISKQFLKR